MRKLVDVPEIANADAIECEKGHRHFYAPKEMYDDRVLSDSCPTCDELDKAHNAACDEVIAGIRVEYEKEQYNPDENYRYERAIAIAKATKRGGK